jgi:hypothetical protein
MKVTKDILDSLTSSKGVMSKEAIKLLGVGYPLIKGWRKRVIGTEIDSVEYYEQLEGFNKPRRTLDDLETLCEYGERTRG